MKGYITKNFRWEEFERSSKAAELGIDNTIPDNTVAENIRALAFSILQPLRDACGHPLRVNSGYRSKALNKAVKGAANSQHTKGEAADIHEDNPFTLAWLVLHIGLPFDQLILYDTFIHLSYKRRGPQRGQILYDQSYKAKFKERL